MKYKLQITILLILTFSSCKNKIDYKILGKWEGIRTLKTGITGSEFTQVHRIEFSDDNKGWEKSIDLENGNPYKVVVFEYSIKGDSIFFINIDKSKEQRHINILTDSKLILTSQISGTKYYYELNKTN